MGQIIKTQHILATYWINAAVIIIDDTENGDNMSHLGQIIDAY